MKQLSYVKTSSRIRNETVFKKHRRNGHCATPPISSRLRQLTPMFGVFDLVYQPKIGEIGKNFQIYKKFHGSEV